MLNEKNYVNERFTLMGGMLMRGLTVVQFFKQVIFLKEINFSCFMHIY